MSRFVTKAVILSTSILASSTAWAQSAPGRASLDAGASSDELRGITEIIVTAQRRAENLQDVPVSVAAVSGSQLAAAGVSDLEGLRQVVPGLTFNSIQLNVQPRLRGIGSSTAGPGIEPGVAVYVDGVYYASATGALFSFNNVDQVSVLKGPQGTLFGRNAVAGLVQITTKTPGQDFQLEAHAGYGNYDTKKASFYVAGGLTDNLAVDLAATGVFQGKGYGRNLTLNTETNRMKRDVNLRSKAVYTPGEDTKITLTGDYSNTYGTMGAIHLERGTVPAPPTGPAFGGRVWDVTADYPGFNKVESGGGNLKVEHKFGSVNFLSISAYRSLRYNNALDLDVTGTPFQGIRQTQSDRQFSQELQLQSSSNGPFKWTLGGFYFNSRDASDPLRVQLFGAAVSPFFPLVEVNTFGKQKTRSPAVYGQASYLLPSDTTITLGARYTSERREVYTFQVLKLVSPIPPVPLPPSQAQATFNKVTFRIAVDQKISDDAMVYGSFNRGFKSGGFNAQQLGAPAFRPEVLDAYEAGFKTRLFDRKATLNGSAFYYDYKDIQIQRINADGSLGILNGAKARAYGVDIDFAASLTEDLQITGGLEYLNTKFLNFPGAPLSTATGGTPVLLGPATGNRLPIAPAFTLSLSPQYTYHLPNDGTITLNSTLSYNSGWFTEPDNQFRQPRFVQLNAKVRWNSPSERYSVDLWAENITNSEVRTNAGTIANGNKFASFAPPRTFGIEVSYKY